MRLSSTLATLAGTVLALTASAANAGDLDVIVSGSSDAVARHGGRVKGPAGRSAFAVRIPAARVAALRADPEVAYVEEDGILSKCSVPNDPLYSNQWGIGKIRANDVWDNISTGLGVVIAICDTGVDFGHEDLGSAVYAGSQHFYAGALDPHGTHCAGIAAARTNNGLGVAGTAPAAKVYDVRVLDSTGSGSLSTVANGIEFAANSGAKVISLSLGASSGSRTLLSAVSYAWTKGLVICAAAGNSGSSQKFYPAAYTNCIAVAASTSTDGLASFSNRGNKWVDVAAPGAGIWSTMFPYTDDYGVRHEVFYESWNGTSMATPFVSGIAALAWSTPGYNASNTKVRAQIEKNCDRILTTYVTWGRVNAYSAVTVSK